MYEYRNADVNVKRMYQWRHILKLSNIKVTPFYMLKIEKLKIYKIIFKL